MGAEFYFLLGSDWVVSCCCLLSVYRTVCVCVFVFKAPFSFLAGGISVLGHESSGCQTPSSMEAVTRAMGAARPWKPAPRMTSRIFLSLKVFNLCIFAHLQATICEHLRVYYHWEVRKIPNVIQREMLHALNSVLFCWSPYGGVICEEQRLLRRQQVQEWKEAL